MPACSENGERLPVLRPMLASGKGPITSPRSLGPASACAGSASDRVASTRPASGRSKLSSHPRPSALARSAPNTRPARRLSALSTLAMSYTCLPQVKRFARRLRRWAEPCAEDHPLHLCTASQTAGLGGGGESSRADNALDMKLDVKTLSLSPALRAALADTISTQVRSSPKPEAAAAMGAACSAPSVQLRSELDGLSGSILAAFGKKSLGELAPIGMSDCAKLTTDPLDALVLYSLVVAIQVHCPPVEPVKSCGPKPPRREPLPKLSVSAKAGVFESRAPAPRAIDPLILVFDKVAPSTPENPTHLYLINKSNLDDRTPILLPGDPSKAVDGRYSLVLGDAWMAEHGIRPSQSLSFYQTRGSAKATARSEETTVSVNAEGPGLIPTPALPPGDRVGEVSVREMFRKALDIVPAPVRPENLAHALEGGQARLSLSGSCPATEPFARVVLQNLRTGERGPMSIVGEDDRFATGVAAQPGDPVLVRIFDHSRSVDDPQFERRLSFLAGGAPEVMLAVNPMLGIDAPPTLRFGRLELGGKNCEEIRGKLAATPGSVVSALRIGLDGKASELARTVAGAQGSFALALPEGVHTGDIYEITVESPFALGPNRAEVQKRAALTARLEVRADGALDRVSSSGAVHDRGTKLGDAPVAALQNVDRVDSGEPFYHPLEASVLGLDLRFEPYNPNTGNGASMKVASDGRAAPRSMVRWDQEHGEVVVALAPAVAGGWPEEPREHQVNVGFAVVGGTHMGFQNPGVGPVRNAMLARAQGDRVAVRFERPGGETFLRGELVVEVKTEGTGSGVGGTQQTRYAKLDPASLTKVGG